MTEETPKKCPKCGGLPNKAVTSDFKHGFLVSVWCDNADCPMIEQKTDKGDEE